MKVLLDTNVILDVFLSREPNIQAAEKIFEMVYNEKIEAYTTASSITDIYYITAKRLGDKPTREALRNLFNLLGIIAVDGGDCTVALDLPISDFEDALVFVCAGKVNIDYIITNDNGFLNVDSELANVISPVDFLALKF